MGAKGPILILVFGVGALVAFGILAKIAIDESSQVQAVIATRTELADRFGADRVGVEVSERGIQVRIWDPEEWQPPADEAVYMTAFTRDLRALLQPSVVPARVDLQVLRAGGCESERPLWMGRAELDADRARLQEQLSVTVGSQLELKSMAFDHLRLTCARRVSPAKMTAVVRRMAALWGGGWRLLEVRTAGRVHEFDGAGEPVRR